MALLHPTHCFYALMYNLVVFLLKVLSQLAVASAGSKWTALQRTLGWRHFRATEKTKRGKHVYALMMATCDPAACLWVSTTHCCIYTLHTLEQS